MAESKNYNVRLESDEYLVEGNLSITCKMDAPADPPIDPVDPPEDPVDPVDPVDPPEDPVDPVDPIDPPEDPVDPVDPPQDPVDPPMSVEDATANIIANAGHVGDSSTFTVRDGSLSVSAADTIIENMVIRGTVRVQANAHNVIVRNCVIESEAPYGVQANFGAQNLLVHNVTFTRQGSSAILGDNFVFRNNHVFDVGADAAKPGHNCDVLDNYFERLGYKDDAHADGVQIVAGSNVNISGNYFDMINGEGGYKNSQCCMVQTNNGPVTNVNVTNNYIKGGGYSLQFRNRTEDPTECSIEGNVFFRDSYQFGPWIVDGDGVAISGNTYEDGSPVEGQDS